MTATAASRGRRATTSRRRTSRAAPAAIGSAANSYMAGIEEAGAPGLRALPHFRAKNHDPFLVFEPLVAELVGEGVGVPPARVGCDGDDDVPTVFALPDAAAHALLETPDAQ